MKRVVRLRSAAGVMMVAGVTAGLVLTGCSKAAEDKAPATQAVELKTDDQKISYSIGFKSGEDLGRFYKQVDAAAFADGFSDALASKESKIKPEEMMALLQSLQQRVMDEQRAAADKMSTDNKAKGVKYLEDNGKREGVTTLTSGVQYEVVTAGKGDTPDSNDTVKVHYQGSLIDGTVFDSSIQRGEPVTFPVDGVIPGWTEVLQKMKVGDKWKVAIPSDQAYGDRGAGDRIGPNETLLFDIELLEVQKND